MLRIRFDPNSILDGAYWMLSYGESSFDSVAKDLQAADGMRVTIYYEDEEEAFELEATLHIRSEGLGAAPHWVAVPNDASFRRIK